MNTTALGSYSTSHVSDTDEKTRTTGVFAVDFPAASYCYNYRGANSGDAVGSWYLPSKSELNEISTQYVVGSRFYIAISSRGSGMLSSTDNYWSSTSVLDGGVYPVWVLSVLPLTEKKLSVISSTVRTRCIKKVQ